MSTPVVLSPSPAVLDEIDEGIAKKKLGVGAWLAIGWVSLLVLASVLAPVGTITSATRLPWPPEGLI